MTKEQMDQMRLLLNKRSKGELGNGEEEILNSLLNAYYQEQQTVPNTYKDITYDDDFMSRMSSLESMGGKYSADPYKSATEQAVQIAVKKAKDFQAAKKEYQNAKTEEERAAAMAKMDKLREYEQYSTANSLGYGPTIGNMSSQAQYLSQDNLHIEENSWDPTDPESKYDPTYHFGGDDNMYLQRRIGAEGQYEIKVPQGNGTYKWIAMPDGADGFQDFLMFRGYEWKPSLGVWYSPKTGQFLRNDSDKNGVFTDPKTKQPIDRVNLKHTAPDLDAWRKVQEEKKKAATEPAPAPGGGGDVPPGAVREEYKPIAQNTWKNDGSLASIAERRAAWQMA